MAFIHMNLISTALMRTVPVNVIIPADKAGFSGYSEKREQTIQNTLSAAWSFGKLCGLGERNQNPAFCRDE